MLHSNEILELAGFAFAHATWSLSDLPAEELLVPLAFLEAAGRRELLRFEAESQAEAIANGKATIAEQEDRLQRWVLVYEGQIEEDGVPADILIIEAKKGNKASCSCKDSSPTLQDNLNSWANRSPWMADNQSKQTKYPNFLASCRQASFPTQWQRHFGHRGKVTPFHKHALVIYFGVVGAFLRQVLTQVFRGVMLLPVMAAQKAALALDRTSVALWKLPTTSRTPPSLSAAEVAPTQ